MKIQNELIDSALRAIKRNKNREGCSEAEKDIRDYIIKLEQTQLQCYCISEAVMEEIIRLLMTDGVNSKKEVLGIFETYVREKS